MIDLSVLASAPRPYAVEDARRELREHGVARGLLAVRASRHEYANDIVLAAADRALLPVGTINPVQYLDCARELDRVQSVGAVAVRFVPDVAHSEAFRSIASRARVPLLVPVTRFGDATAIGEATTGAVPVVLTGAHYTQLGDCLAALERWPHLLLETSHLAHFRAIETVVHTVGAERVLFGSGTPGRPIQAALNMVLSARISPSEQRMILGANAARLFSLPLEPFDLPSSSHATGLLDVHSHFGALGLPTPTVCTAEHVAEARRHGITRTIASSLRAIAEDVATGNAEALACCCEELRAYVVVDPNDLDASCKTMDAAYKSDYVVGAKLHCSYAHASTASGGTVALLHEVARRGRPLLIHVDGPDWKSALLEVAHAYPRWKVIVAHSGPGTPVRAAAELVEDTANVYLELSTSMPDLPVVREVVQRVGRDRLLFGSDAPLLDTAYELGLYADAGASLESTSAVAREVFGW